MRGHIRKRGSKWTVVVDVGRDENGKRIRKWHSGYERRKDAERALSEILARLDSASYVEPDKLTVERFLVEEWLPTVERTVRPLSYTQYEQVVRIRIVPRIGHVRLQRLAAGHLNALYTELEREGLSASSKRLTHAVLHRALRDAVRLGRLVRNPAELADPPARGRSRAQAWTAAELSPVPRARRRDDDRLYALWRLAATTGMRRGELAGLTWRTLDLDGARLSVEQQLVPTRGGVSFGPPKSARSRRTIALDPETVDALRTPSRRAAARARLRRRRLRRPGPRVRRRARRPDPPAAPDRVVRQAPQGRRDPDRDASHPAPHRGDAGAHVRGPGPHRRGAAWR